MLSACATVPLETASIPADISGWDVGYAKDIAGQGNIVEFVQSPETINDWTKLITIQFFEGYDEAPRPFMDKLKIKVHGDCPKVSWNVIRETESTILYEWIIDGCTSQEDQHELAKLLKGNDGLHRASYVEKTKLLDSNTREQWIKWLTETHLTKNGERIQLN